MTKAEVCQRIQEIGVIPAIWVTSAEDVCFAAESLESGGIPILEVTITGPAAIDLIAHTVSHHRKVIVGAGTVLDTEMAKRAAAAGASFLTAPGFDYSILELAAKENVAIVPGALTPTEVITAWRVGADFVKVFPCSQVGGDKYIRALKKAVPQIPLIAAGGVTQHTATSFILAGAAALGVGTDLIPPDAIEQRQVERIQELSHRFLAFVNNARTRLAAGKVKRPSAKR